MKNNKGITLIALVITIIVLLILAGISIAMLTGNNGLLTKANDAKNDTATAEAKERINMELNALYASVLASSTKDKFTEAEVGAVNKNLPTGVYTVKSEKTEKNGIEKITTIKISTTVENVTEGSITITSAGQATLTPATISE